MKKSIPVKIKILSTLFFLAIFLAVSAQGAMAGGRVEHSFYLKLPNGSTKTLDEMKGLTIHSVFLDELNAYGGKQKLVETNLCGYVKPWNTDRYGGLHGGMMCGVEAACDLFGWQAPFFPANFNKNQDIYEEIRDGYLGGRNLDASYFHFYNTTFSAKYPWFNLQTNADGTMATHRGNSAARWQVELLCTIGDNCGSISIERPGQNGPFNNFVNVWGKDPDGSDLYDAWRTLPGYSGNATWYENEIIEIHHGRNVLVGNVRWILTAPVVEPEITCLTKTSSKTTNIVPGENITYTVTANIDNPYPTPPTQVITIDNYDQTKLSVNSAATPSFCQDDGDKLTCTDTSPASRLSNGVYTLQYGMTAKAGASGTAANQIGAIRVTIGDTLYRWNGTTAPAGVCETSVSIAAPSAECVSKSLAVSTASEEIEPGEDAVFTIQYRNNGDIPGTILVDDEVPNGFEEVEVSNVTVSASGVTVSTDNCEVSDNTVSCEFEDIPAGASGTVVITATAKNNVRDLETDNTAYVNIDADNDGQDDIEDSACSTAATVSEANAACESKSASPGTVNPGDIVTYQIDYTVERGPATVHITDVVPEYTSIYTGTDACRLPSGCTANGDTLSCTITSAQTGTYVNSIQFCVQVDETGIPLEGVTINNNQVKVWEGTDADEPTDYDEDCTTTFTVEHEPPACLFVTGGPLVLRVADGAQTLTATGALGSHSDLEFNWVVTGGTVSVEGWHDSSGDPYEAGDGSMRVDDVLTWTPPAGAAEDDQYTLTVYVRADGDTGDGVTADDCQTTATITALDLYCIYLSPNESFDFFPVDMTFEADIGGDAGAAFTYDLDFGDDSDHYTGSGTVASGSTVELPYIPPQSSPHTYDSLTATTYNPVLRVTNTETGEVTVCPTILPGKTQSDWTIVKDSDVDTCVVQNSVVAYSIVVTNSGDYTADLEEVRDTIDPKINTDTITNIRECDANGQNCTTYNKADVLSGRTITWPGRTFEAGESRKYMYNVTVSTAGDYYNIAEAVPTSGEIVRDDETFPTCTGTTTPTTGALSSAVYALALAGILGGVGIYAYETKTGAQVMANVLGKAQRATWRKMNRKEAFERDSIKSSKKKA